MNAPSDRARRWADLENGRRAREHAAALVAWQAAGAYGPPPAPPALVTPDQAPKRTVGEWLKLAYTGAPHHSTARRVTQGALVGLFTLSVVGAAVSPETEKASSSAPAPVVAATMQPPRGLVGTVPTTPAPPTTAPPVAPAAPKPTTAAPKPPAPRPTTAKPVARPTTAPPKKAAAPPAAASTCGAPANPWGYNFCGRGSFVSSPPDAFCSYFDCIDSFWESTNGYVMQCEDGMFSHSGGRRGSCSHHGGNSRPLYG